MSIVYCGLLMLALVVLTSQGAYASYHYESNADWFDPYFGHKPYYVHKPKCVAEGEDCETPHSVCCSGLTCQLEFWPIGSRCRDELKNDNMIHLRSRLDG